MATPSKQRPFELDPLFRSVRGLPGIGPKLAKNLERLIGGETLRDLLFHKPIEIINRKIVPSIGDLPAGQTGSLILRVERHTPNPRRSIPYRVDMQDNKGAVLTLVFFHARHEYIQKILPVSEEVLISGRIENYQGKRQMTHPDYILPVSEQNDMPEIEPVYPMTQGVSGKTLTKAVSAALEQVPDLPEWLDPALLKKQGWPSWKEAILCLHRPENAQGLSADHVARQRLAYDELLSSQLALALLRHHTKVSQGRALKGTGDLKAKLKSALPFALTGAQERELEAIFKDMAESKKMLRLLQGDVGSGKTVVALFAALQAVESGTQAAIMAPTEILARQHAEGLQELCTKIGVRLVTLTGRDKGKARELILKQIADGTAQIVVGTHALFQESVTFHDLGLAVIDEQHRFGVHQRMQLSSKGAAADTLVMTATPIPRTLTLTLYGDMDVSKLDEKPPGRKPIDTRLLSLDRLDELAVSLKRKIAEGNRVYWVCPLVEESEKIDLAAAEDRYMSLKDLFGERIGLVHGRMKPEEKDATMSAFARGDLDILVATTVIEVGVNVPEATIMVIEHAERFGLSQLHQLRGRVGRGDAQSHCFLLYGKLSETGKTRLKTMRDSEDGFYLAEKDLDLRGMGDVLGTRQSGMPEMRLADLDHHRDLLEMARDDARLLVGKDPKLEGPRGEALKVLLHLFDRSKAIQYFLAG